MNPSNDEFSQDKPRYQAPAVGNVGNKNSAPNPTPAPNGWPGVPPNPNFNPNQPSGWPQPGVPPYQMPPNVGGWGPYRNVPPMPPVPVPPPDPQAEAYKRAAKRVEAKLAFWKHLGSYIIVNGFLWIMAFITSGNFSGHSAGRYWPIWITLCWGIGLAFQAWSIWGPGEHLREKMIEEEIEKMRNKSHRP